jgi:uncharacterized protein YukE
MSAPLSQATSNADQLLSSANDLLSDADRKADSIHEEQYSILGSQWHGDAANRYRRDSDSLNEQLKSAIKTFRQHIETGHTTVRATANADNG